MCKNKKDIYILFNPVKIIIIIIKTKQKTNMGRGGGGGGGCKKKRKKYIDKKKSRLICFHHNYPFFLSLQRIFSLYFLPFSSLPSFLPSFLPHPFTSSSALFLRLNHLSAPFPKSQPHLGSPGWRSAKRGCRPFRLQAARAYFPWAVNAGTAVELN